METNNIYVYKGKSYPDNEAVQFDKEGLKFIKQVKIWGGPSRQKCKRADRIQHCYAMLLKKGFQTPVLPDKRYLTYEDYRPLERWLELVKDDVKAYMEPLRIAKQIYFENN